ncbi:MAG: PAS domain S-box protein [Cyanobacteria bacterium J06621_15]
MKNVNNILIALSKMSLFLVNLLASSLMPHGTCYLWKPGLVGLHLVSDTVIALSYFSIPITLIYILRKRVDVPFNGIFILFAAFIIFCGTGHLIDIWTLWHPDYWVSGYIRAITAVVSFITAIALINLIPQILALPTPQKLREEIQNNKRKEEFLRSIYEGVTEAIFVIDTTKKGKFIYESINPVTEKVMGITSKQIEGKTPEEVLPNNFALAVKERYNQCLSTRENITYEECLRFSENNDDSWWLTSLKPLFNEQGEIYRIISTSVNITERKQAEARLRESEERWELTLLGTGDGIFDWNIISNQAFFSTQYKEMLGFTDEEVENSYDGWRNLVHPEDIDSTEAIWQAYLNHETPQYRAEFRMLCKDGGYKWILARGMAQWNQDGEAIRMVGSHQDISQRKAAQAEIVRLNQQLEARVMRRTAQLEESNRRKDELIESEQSAKAEIKIYEDIVENIQIGLCIWQMDNIDDITSFRLKTTNPAASQMLGIDIQNYVGKSIEECFPNVFGEDHVNIIEAYAEVVKSKQAKDLGEFSYGDERVPTSCFEVTAFPLPDNLMGVAFNNLSERKRMELALAESERLYRNVVNSVKEVIFQINKTGIWTFLSAAWNEITGFSVEENLFKPFTDIIYADEEKTKAEELFESVILGEAEFFQYEFRILTKNGNFRWLEIYAQIEHDSSSENIGVYGTLNDVTERKQTEAVLEARADELAQMNLILLQTTAELEKRNKELDQFAYVTSHDLKAPLRAIANLSEWIEEDLQAALTPDTQKQMDLLRGRVYRMEALINGLLQYSRVGRIKTEPETVVVAQLIAEIIDSIAPPQDFTIEIIGEMPTLVTERIPLQQVFSNLISNAIKHHNRSDGKVTISIQEQEKFYEFTVADDGKGIASQYHDKIFVIFQTLESRDKRENTGIGLAIVKRIIEENGGMITLESQLGEGTSFRFTWFK